MYLSCQRETPDSLCIQHPIHGVLEECFNASAGKLVIRTRRDGEEVNEDATQKGGDGHGAFTTDVLQVYGVLKPD